MLHLIVNGVGQIRKPSSMWCSWCIVTIKYIEQLKKIPSFKDGDQAVSNKHVGMLISALRLVTGQRQYGKWTAVAPSFGR
jgi:hypothetical protein